MRSKFFSVQLLIEDTDAVSGYDSAETFKQDLEETIFEDFPNYKPLLYKTTEVDEEELLEKLKI